MSAAINESARTKSVSEKRAKGYRGLAMEGSIARWYAKVRGGPEQVASSAAEARRLTEHLADGSRILEVAPGPGVLSVELARLGRYEVTAVDISRTFVELATERARGAGVRVTFLEGNASALPLADSIFELIVCQAAFKNFSEPQKAVNEMYRVLRPGGAALIQDLRKDATNASIREEVAGMRLGRVQTFATIRTLRSLRRRAYTQAEFEAFARSSRFGRWSVSLPGIGLEVRLEKASPPSTPTREGR